MAAALASACACAALAAVTVASAAPRATRPDLAPAQLAAMTLPRDQIQGAKLAALQSSRSSGDVSLDDAPRYTLDPKDTPEDLDASGWIGAYDRSWGPGFAPDGSFFGGSTVQLFADDATAALYHARQIEAFRLFQGKPVDGGWTLASATLWQVKGLGPDAWAMRNVFRSKAGTFYDTEVHLRVGRVVGEVGIIASRSTDLRAAIEADGRLLLQRIRKIAPRG